VRRVNRATERLLAKMPAGGAQAFVRRQRVNRPFFTPVALVRGMDAALADVTPLYAGECVSKIGSLASAAAVVKELAGV
jgi:hypothetical protein